MAPIRGEQNEMKELEATVEDFRGGAEKQLVETSSSRNHPDFVAASSTRFPAPVDSTRYSR